MAGQRTYGDACGIARALDLVGERWALMVTRELVLGPKRFTDLRAALPHIGPDMLSLRLKELIDGGIVVKDELPPPAASKVYALTDLGHELEPVLDALGKFGARLPMTMAEPQMSFDAHVLSFRTVFSPAKAGTTSLRVGMVLDGKSFSADVSDGQLTLVPGAADRPQAVISGTADAVLAAAHGRIDLDEALAEGAVTITGDRRVGRRFLSLFPLPMPAITG